MVDLPEEEGVWGGEEGGTQGWNPIQIDFDSVTRQRGVYPKTSYEITMPQAFVWMFLGCSAAFAISLVTERTRGTLMRLRSAPVTLTQILAGKALACFTTTIAALVLLYLFFALVFKVRPDSIPLLALAFVCSSLAFVGIMMLISVMGRTEASVGGIGWAFLIVMAMLGGGMLPLFFMPSWMQTVSNFSFVKWTVLAVEGAVWRGFTLGEMLLPCGILVGIGAVCFAIGVRVFRVTVD
jgi:ABC-2 type transport system permease protein